MSSSLERYPPDLSSEEEQYLLSNLKDWSIAHGLAVRPAPTFVSSSQDPSGVLATTAPVTLFPSLFPRQCFEDGLAIQKAYNELYSAIARDEQWLQGIVEEYAQPILPVVYPLLICVTSDWSTLTISLPSFGKRIWP